MKRYVITGGAGYIGASLAHHLANHAALLTIDREHHPHIKADFSSPVALEAMREFRPDTIIHTAASHIVPHSVQNPAEFYHNNVVKTHLLLEEIRTWKNPPQIIFSSTAAVYGDIHEPATENTIPNPQNPYGRTKLTTEFMLQDYARSHGIPAIALRYFNAAGATAPHLGQQSTTHLIARALQAARNNRPIAIYGDDYPTPDGTAQRDYIHVADLISAHLAADEYLDHNPGYHVFNLGTGQPSSNLEIITQIKRVFPSLEVEMAPRRQGDPATLVADSSRARELLHWLPQNSSTENIIRTAAAAARHI